MDILYTDENIIALLKPAGVPSQPDSSNDESVLSFAERLTGGQCYIINRLDRPVGGICILAKDKRTAAELTRLMTNGETKKYYNAVVCGNIEQSGTLNDYIFFNKRQNMSKIVNSGSMGAKAARLEFEKLCTDGSLSLIRIRLYTGRHHQIRVQLANHGFPVWGDTKYNSKFRFARNVSIALFACEYSFVHPYKNRVITIKAESDFTDIIKCGQGNNG